MKNTFKYLIDDFEQFKNELSKIVDTTVDCNCKSIDPSLLKSEYFGKIESDKFTIFHKSCVLSILGCLKNNVLTIEFNFPNRYNAIFDLVLFTLVGGSIMYDINFYLGLAVVLFVIIQKLYFYISEEEKKKAFLKKMEELLHK